MTRRVWTFCLAVLGLALLLAALSPLASSRPDGLERVVEDHGPAPAGEQPTEGPAPMPDYKAPGRGGKTVGRILAGLAGTLAAFGLAAGVGWLIGLRRKSAPAKEKPGATPTAR